MNVSIPAFNLANVLVVGDIMLDRYWYGSTNRISPEAPVPVVKINNLEERPGGAANVALNVSSLGGRVRLVGLVGEDEPASILARQLQEVNIDCHFIALASHPTITKLRIISRNQQLIRVDFEEGVDEVSSESLVPGVETLIPQSDVIIFSDYGKGGLFHVQKMIQLAKIHKKSVLVDPKGTDFLRYKGATLLTPNLNEFEAVVGTCNSEQDIINKGIALIHDLDLEALLITRSEQGMTLLQKEGTVFHLATQAKEVYDVTGAGDTVIATLAAALAAGKSLQESCYLANAAAGIVVGKLGTSAITFVELEDAIRGRAEAGFGVMDEPTLKTAVLHARQRGEKVVMTNGCFDLLHAGHVSYLSQARKLGDRLIVAVNSDQSVKSLKGDNRPITPLSQRMIVLGALESVDWVVPFEEQTPERLIAEILPDILVKGGDYHVDDIAGGKQVLAAGGDIKVLNFEEGCSTTTIIHKIKSTC